MCALKCSVSSRTLPSRGILTSDSPFRRTSQFELEKSDEYREIETRLQPLRSSSAARKERRALYEAKRRLIRQKLRECREQQPCRPPFEVKLDNTYEMGRYRTRFACRMMPQRDRLATNLLEVASPRSDVGLQCLPNLRFTMQGLLHMVQQPPTAGSVH